MSFPWESSRFSWDYMRAHGRRLWSLGGYAIAAVILIVLVNLMLAGEELFDRLMDIYIFYL